jgi:pyruvate/2-oxoglutarate dehydrogenase complex dihydrolipoamide dehydrogenase (E3) component
MTDVLVIGAGPAGVLAALRAADLGAQTALVTSGAFGGMAANDGPVPVRTLAHAGRLMREARQLGQYGVKVSEPVLDYSRLLARGREVDSVAVKAAQWPRDRLASTPGGIDNLASVNRASQAAGRNRSLQESVQSIAAA